MNSIKRILIITTLVIAFGITQKISWQYYYYDSWTSTYPYQQWCSETLNVRINSQWKSVRAGRFHLILDPTRFSYNTSTDPNTLRTNLFEGINQTFIDRSSAGSPTRKDPSNTILEIDRTNTTTDYNWTDWLYWNIKFIPLYNISTFYWSFGMEYVSWSATIETTLSRTWWVELINPSAQTPNLTWTYQILQEPCVADADSPSINISVPINQWNKQSKLSWVSLSLDEAGWVNGISNVPYIRTWWIWTGNQWWAISNQYWINLNSFNFTIEGNWQTKTFTSWSLWVTAVWNWKTRQNNSKNYNITIDQAQLFDYWIEKTITVTTDISDRKWNNASQNEIRFNYPIWPRLLWSRNPNNGDRFVNLSTPIKLGIQDNRAWVDSGTIKITLSWINWTNYWPYIFTGNSLNLSWLVSTANQPNYNINIINHPNFPASWTIKISVEVRDMENNLDTIDDYSFSTRPDCSALQCCDVTIITRSQQIPYDKIRLYISWRNSPIFYTWTNWSGYVNCNSQDVWLKIYNWDWSNPWLASILSSYYDKDTLILSWRNWVKATLSWNTIYLSIIDLFGFHLTWAILFSWRELETWTLVWPADLDLTIENSFNSWIVIQSTWNDASPEVIEAYLPSYTTIIQTWTTCTPIVIQQPIMTWKTHATSSLPDYDIYTTFKIWFACLWTNAKFYDMSWNTKAVEIRVRDPNLIATGITKVRYSIDLINRNAMWTANVVNHVASFKTINSAYFAIWNDKPIRVFTWCISSCGGGGITIEKDDCPDWDYSDSYYDRDCWAPESHEIINYCWVGETEYSYEEVDAFQYAYWLWITTMCPIETARLDWYILRKELAKMISQFAIKVIWLYPNFSKTECDRYRDIWKESEELQFYMKLSCRLWLMWLHTDWITVKANFDPNDYVDRAQFGTIMSRLIFWGKYNWNRDNRYIDHLQALKKYKIMKYIDNPAMKELRSYVMIMMQRADESGIIREMRAVTDFINWANNLWEINLYNPPSE